MPTPTPTITSTTTFTPSATTTLSRFPNGVHYTLELYDCPAERLDDVVFIEAALREAAERAHCELLKIALHHFAPHGVTAVALLAESHLSIHTWPEHGYAAVDLFTCGENVYPRAACEFLADRFSARTHEINMLSRNR